MTKTITATIWREDDGYVSLCSELDIASQGKTVEEARTNLREAVELFFEMAHPNEIKERLNQEIYISPLEVEIEKAA
jgi:predicted RNase H-like HicB family nuclease